MLALLKEKLSEYMKEQYKALEKVVL
jgi:hypothetical protein